MTDSLLRAARLDEMDTVYRLGRDVWSGEMQEQEYLAECRASPKYKSGKWYVLVRDKTILSAAIVYDFGNDRFGIGSLATDRHFRKRGHALQLLGLLLAELKSQSPDALVFLYADIAPEFYQKAGFSILTQALQRRAHAFCMVYPAMPENLLLDDVPGYF